MGLKDVLKYLVAGGKLAIDDVQNPDEVDCHASPEDGCECRECEDYWEHNKEEMEEHSAQ